jgi:hypothetical protein
VGGSDDDLGSGVGHSDLATGVTLLSELSSEELVDLGVEDSVWTRGSFETKEGEVEGESRDRG